VTLTCVAPYSPEPESERTVALIIDDDADTRRTIVNILRVAGWRVLEARNGEHGLLMAREHVPDVILVDLALPKMSGLEVLRELKSPRWDDQPTPVVVVSFFASLMRLSDLRRADGVVNKPFSAVDLLGQTCAALAHRRAPVLR
jgi:CheY-like chemotaxis protein